MERTGGVIDHDYVRCLPVVKVRFGSLPLERIISGGRKGGFVDSIQPPFPEWFGELEHILGNVGIFV